MTTRLSLILLMIVLGIITLAGAPDPMLVSIISARPYEAGELTPKHSGTFTAVSHRENFLSGAWTSDKSTQLRVHLALRLVRRSELNEKQIRIILDAMSVVDDPQALRRRALATLSRHEVADLFATGGTADQDLLKMYYDVS